MALLDDELVNLSFKAIKKAGEIALEYSKKDITFEYKSKNQPVTKADLEINNFLKKFFQDHTPMFGWISEESVDNKSRFKNDLFWCVDPIDGTRSFINKKPEYSISIALVDRNKQIFGIVYNPSTNENFYAIKNKGAFCNEKKITVGETNELESATIAISSSESDKLEKKKLQIKDIEKIGSIAYKIALVAKGKIDATLSFTRKSDWDIAAASLILQEAGGKISLINGDEISYNTQNLKIPSLISANKIIHKKFCDIIRN